MPSRPGGPAMNSFFRIQEAERYQYLTVPKELFRGVYKDLKPGPKLLYGLLLDRVGLSRKNNWVDAEGRVYIIYPRQEIADELGVNIDTVTSWFKILVSYDLVDDQQRGMNLPNLLYVKKWYSSDDEGDFSGLGKIPNPRTRKNSESGIPKTPNLESENFRRIYPDPSQPDPSDPDQSVSHASSPEGPTDRLTDDEPANDLIAIFERVDLADNQPRQKLWQPVLEYMFWTPAFARAQGMPIQLIRKRMQYITADTLNSAFKRVSEHVAATGVEITHKTAYLATAVFNEIGKQSADQALNTSFLTTL